MNLTALYDAMEIGSLAILLKLTGEDGKAAATFAEARKAAAELGPLSITGQAIRVALEGAEAAEVDVEA